MATVTRNIYRRWSGLETDLAQLTPGNQAEDHDKTAILRITDMYFCTNSNKVFWWTGTSWVQI